MCKTIGKGYIMSIIRQEVDLHVMWRLKLRDFTEDFAGHNLENYQEFLSQCKLEGDQLLH
jgi:hypothetical protein